MTGLSFYICVIVGAAVDLSEFIEFLPQAAKKTDDDCPFVEVVYHWLSLHTMIGMIGGGVEQLVLLVERFFLVALSIVDTAVVFHLESMRMPFWRHVWDGVGMVVSSQDCQAGHRLLINLKIERYD